MNLAPFILAGGRGHRLWPASRPGRSKQVLRLTGGEPLIRQTWARVAGLAGGSRVRILTVRQEEESVRRLLPEAAVEDIWVEPEGRNTAPSIAWALHEASVEAADQVAAFFPSDHCVGDGDRLAEAVRRAAAVSDRIVLLGVRPDRPETGYGYIEAGGEIARGVRDVRRFLEKPDAATAATLVRRKDVFWNSGIFIMGIGEGLAAIRDASPELGSFLDALPRPGTARRGGGPARRALAAAFDSVPSLPFDVAVMERASRRAVIPLDAAWSDLGTWQAVWEARPKDAAGNAASPGSLVVDCEGCLVEGEGSKVAALGLRDLIIVASGDTILVCPRERAQEVKGLAVALDAAGETAG